MIQWYDILLSILTAWLLLNLAFFPYIGFILAYGVWEGWNRYCLYRLKMENNKWG